MKSTNDSDYLLGVNNAELERLRFQHTVWGEVTRNFFKRVNIQHGWKCLDVGAGPGLVSADLREMVGEEGEVTAVEPSSFYIECLREKIEEKQWRNVRYIQGTAEQVELPREYFDLIFVRWVVAFTPDPEKFILNLLPSLKKGGVILFEEYYYEGLSVYPHGKFNEMANCVKAYYRSVGGDPYVAGLIPSIFRKHGLTLSEYHPTCLAGGPESGITEWGGLFFILHTPVMVEKGIITQDQAGVMLDEWNKHRENPDMIFFSPIVVDIAGVK